jgi:hypothetical protein
VNTKENDPMSTAIRRTLTTLAGAAVLLAATSASAAMTHTTSKFEGVKANVGHAVFTKEHGRRVLSVSDDFVVPDTPDPHWQVVDSRGNVYLLQRMPIKGDKVNREIELPGHVKDVAKVQVWCAFAEVLLGEASFRSPVK